MYRHICIYNLMIILSAITTYTSFKTERLYLRRVLIYYARHALSVTSSGSLSTVFFCLKIAINSFGACSCRQPSAV